MSGRVDAQLSTCSWKVRPIWICSNPAITISLGATNCRSASLAENFSKCDTKILMRPVQASRHSRRLWLEKPNVKFCTEASKRLTGGEAFTREDALFSRSACRYNDNMRRRTIDFASRILLLVALATFLSPGF